VVAQVELSWLSPSKVRRTVLVGSEKMVVYEDGASEPVRVFDHGVVVSPRDSAEGYHLSYRTGEIVSPKLDANEPLRVELGTFRRAVQAGDALPYQASLARDVVAIAEAASRSLEAGGAEVRVERSAPFSPPVLRPAPAPAVALAAGGAAG
jgi:hypothetical protein